MNRERKKIIQRAMSSLPPDFLIIVCVIVSALLFAAGLIVPVAPWLKTFIFAACIVLTGYDIVIDTVMKAVRERDFNENLLILAAAAGAFAINRGAEGAAAMLIFRTGGVLHNRTVKWSANAVESIMDLRPESVNAVINGATVQMALGKIKVGDVISVSPGERLALDGVVVSGESELDMSAVNGEAAPVHVTENSAVVSGSVNLTGILTIRVTADFDQSTMTRMMKLAEKAELRKAKPELKIKKIARFYTPAVVAAALIIGVCIPLFGGLPFEPWINRALGFLAVSSPSALVISVPLAYFAGVGGASKKGVIFKGADVVDTIAHTTSVVFDMTGILTDGKYHVADINSRDIPEKRLLMLAAYAELFSNHPIARAIVTEANIVPDFERVGDYQDFLGMGTEIKIGSNTVTAGNALLMEKLGIIPDISQAEASTVYIAVNRQYAGRILLNDTVKSDAKKAVKDLHAIGIDRIAVFSGDKKEVAVDVSGQLGIKEYYAECRADDKLSRLKGLMDMQLPGDTLIFVGDGIDDAPLLKTADVGITIGGLGSDRAVEAADMIVMTDEPSKIASAITLAQNTNMIVRQDIVLSMGLKGLILALVMIGFAGIWLAVLADAVFALIVIINAMRAFGLRSSEIKKALPKRQKAGDNVNEQ